MSDDQSVWVIDTNIIIDYDGIIPGKEGKQPHEPTVDLSEAHLVIPTVVVRELSNFKGEKSDRGVAARTVIRRLRNLFEGDIHTMGDVYNLRAPITVGYGNQLISILPVHKDFWKCLPFHPSSTDMDGQIILTALAASMSMCGLPIDGTAKPSLVEGMSYDNVVLLTNDNGLAIRARERGLRTERYGYKYPEPYTGRRDVVVPAELFAEFYNDPDGSGLSRKRFEELMPNEPRLIANEFIAMRVSSFEDWPAGYNPFTDAFFDCVGRYDAKLDAIVHLRYVRDFPTSVKNIGQAIYAEALMDPEISAVICTGPAGSGKTYMATVFGYVACKNGDFIGVTAVPCENRSNIGALPGDLDEKMDPDVQPLKNALRNYLLHSDAKLKRELEALSKFGAENNRPKKRSKNGNGNGNGEGYDANCQNGDSTNRSIKAKLKDRVDLIWDNWFSNVPIEMARGRDFAYELAIYDEFQDQNASQADTLIKRIGADGKIILTGDVEQIHAPYLDQSNNGLIYASRQLFDSPMVAQVHFTEEEVVRHPLVREIARRQKAAAPAAKK